MNEFDSQDEFQELVEKYFLDDLSEEESGKLQRYLESEKSFRDRFRVSASIDAQLRRVSANELEQEGTGKSKFSNPYSGNQPAAVTKPTKESEITSPASSFTKHLPDNPVGKTLLLIAGLVLLSLICYPMLWNPLKDRLASSKQSILDSKTTLATLIVSTEAEFSENEPIDRLQLNKGSYVLEKGAIAIRFPNGVEVSIESPAKFELIDPLNMKLDLGRARAIVPESGHGFIIQTPQGGVEDLGTEFGVFVGDEKNTEVHVFAGEVNIRKPNQQPVSYLEDSAISISKDGNRSLATNNRAFLTKEQIGFRNWNRQSQKLKSDRSALVYYSFQKPTSANELLNESPSSPKILGKIHGGYRASGRWAGKDSIHFEKPDARIELDVPGKFSEITMFAWVRIDRFDKPLQTIFNTENWDEGEHHWNLTRNGSSRVGIFQNYVATLSNNPVPVGKWTFLAAVFNQSKAETSYFVNGKKVTTSKWNSNKPVSFGRSSIGAYRLKDSKGKVQIQREINGRVDEFGLFRRAFSDDEILEIYRNGSSF